MRWGSGEKSAIRPRFAKARTESHGLRNALDALETAHHHRPNAPFFARSAVTIGSDRDNTHKNALFSPMLATCTCFPTEHMPFDAITAEGGDGADFGFSELCPAGKPAAGTQPICESTTDDDGKTRVPLAPQSVGSLVSSCSIRFRPDAGWCRFQLVVAPGSYRRSSCSVAGGARFRSGSCLCLFSLWRSMGKQVIRPDPTTPAE